MWADANATTTKQRVFLVNVSNDMGDNNKLNATKLALKNYVDRANQGDQLAIITFADVHAVVTPFTALDSQTTRDAVKAQIDSIQVKTGVNDRNIDAAEQAAVAILAQAANNGVIIDRSLFMIIDGGYTDNTEPHIFQKVPDQQGGIPLHIFNFATTNKPNDLYGNSLELMRPFLGSYTVVSPAALNIPGARAKAEDMADSNELIAAFGDVDQDASPILDVDLGTAYNLSVDETTPFSTTIYVDDTLDELEVAVLFEGGSSGVELYLTDPLDQQSDAPLLRLRRHRLALSLHRQRTCHRHVDLRVLLSGWSAGCGLRGHRLRVGRLHLPGDALQPRLYRYVSYPDDVVLQAELSYVDRIAGATATAWVEKPDGNFADLTLLDDGVAPDETTDDGLYTGFMPYDQAGDYYATVVFDNIAGAAFFTQAGLADVTEVITATVPDDFDRFASLEILVDDYAADDHGGDDDGATDVPADNSGVSGRIDGAGDVDTFRLTASQPASGDPKAQGVSVASVDATTVRHILRLTHLAQGMNATVRVSSIAGTQTYSVGTLAYDQYWILPLDLTPGERVTVEVLHNNAQAPAGSYEISFGPPLPGESTVSLYLPGVVK
ncbi:MAG: choice-of-anchor X domain-containing protein [Caldilineaceae bacterium]